MPGLTGSCCAVWFYIPEKPALFWGGGVDLGEGRGGGAKGDGGRESCDQNVLYERRK